MLVLEPVIQQNFQSLAAAHHWDLLAAQLAASWAPVLVSLSRYWWFDVGIGIGAVGGGVGVGVAWIYETLNISGSNPEVQPATQAELRIQFLGDKKTPTIVKMENVSFWYAYYFPSFTMDAQSEDGTSHPIFRLPEHWIVFVLFGRQTNYRQAIARFYSEQKVPQVQVRKGGLTALSSR